MVFTLAVWKLLTVKAHTWFWFGRNLGWDFPWATVCSWRLGKHLEQYLRMGRGREHNFQCRGESWLCLAVYGTITELCSKQTFYEFRVPALVASSDRVADLALSRPQQGLSYLPSETRSYCLSPWNWWLCCGSEAAPRMSTLCMLIPWCSFCRW